MLTITGDRAAGAYVCAADVLSVARGALCALTQPRYQVICIHIYTAACGRVARRRRT